MKTSFCVVMLSLMCQAVTPVSDAFSTKKVAVRAPAVAGQFYPSDATRLANTIDCFLADAIPPAKERPIAIICPHAGYVYSGQIAADAYNQADGHDYDLIVILGTNHTTAGFGGVSIYPGGGYRTPLGIANIDEELATELIDADRTFTFKKSVHEREHSIEVQVPFVQLLFPEAQILAAVIGTPDPDLCIRFGETLANKIKDRKALIVASSDLSHYPAWEDANTADQATLGELSKLDVDAFQSITQKQLRGGPPNLVTCACGAAPVMTAIAAAKKLGATSAQIISYANSGDTAFGKRDRVVGYGAVAFVDGAPLNNLTPAEEAARTGAVDIELSDQHKKALLTFARKSIRQFLTAETPPLARGFDPVLEQEHGAFVTLKKGGELRGCIGHMAGDLPLCQTVGYCALQAAFNDRRFSPVQPDELHEIEIEVSVLTPYRLVDSYLEIQIGRDGVMIEKDGRSAVFLPYVPVEQGWDREEMLEHLCRKAGLARDGWKEGATFYTFQAIAFDESHSH
ncbi:MAG: AmmeMemoRadiSam system protein B [Candidatus Latescibacterota bacterium]|nr:MAG: AmmeMemoRadiSam system protein B [Candidatus Latescibacterota bacterium]